MTDRVRRGFVGSADTDHGDRPEMIRGFAFDEDSHPYYIDHEKRAPLPFPCGDKGGFYLGNFSRDYEKCDLWNKFQGIIATVMRK